MTLGWHWPRLALDNAPARLATPPQLVCVRGRVRPLQQLKPTRQPCNHRDALRALAASATHTPKLRFVVPMPRFSRLGMKTTTA